MRTRGGIFLLALVALAACSRMEAPLPIVTGPTPAELPLDAGTGTSAEGAFAVGNVGAGPLTIEVASAPAWLEVQGPPSRTVPSGDVARVGVLATCPADGADDRYRGVIRLASDDPYRPVIDLPVWLACPSEDRVPANEAPVATIDADPASGEGTAPLEVAFAAAGSTDPDGEIVRYDWRIGDEGTPYRGPEPTHLFEAPGTHPVQLTATDDDGAEDTVLIFYEVLEGGDDVPAEPEDPPEPAPEGGFTIDVRFFGPSEPTASQRRAFEEAAARWSAAIVGDLPDVRVDRSSDFCFGLGEPAVNEVVDDVLILASVEGIDGPGRVLGSAGPCIVRGAGGLPVVGTMQFDEADVDDLEARGRLGATIVHEMGHVLGIGTLWENAGHDLLASDTAECLPSATGWARFVGEEATRQHEAAGGSGRPSVETQGGGGTACGHWSEDRYRGELMTGWLSGGMELSRMTIGSLADLGYEVDLGAADPYVVPSGAALRAPVEGERIREILLHPIDVID